MDYDTTATASSPPALTQQQFSGRIGGSFIAIIVLFTIGMALLILSCSLTRYRRHHNRRRERESIIEKAFDYQQTRVDTLRQQQHRPISNILRAHHHFPSTTSSCMIDMPPPIYEPPSPKNSLPNDVISRLDYLLHMKYQLKHKPTLTSTTYSSNSNNDAATAPSSSPPQLDQQIHPLFSESLLPPPPRYHDN